MNTCRCGCGEFIPIGRNYVHNHHRRKSPVPYLENDNGCWLWQRTLTSDGYGMMGIGGRKTRRSHAVYYEQKYGPVPEGHELHHTCGVRSCVNPDHIEPTTRLEHRSRHPRNLKCDCGSCNACRSRERWRAVNWAS